jgi:ABC-type transport system involved in multi-copper enzyme maturation permease subunit
MQFKNPQNGYVETAYTGFSWLLCLLFGCLYFLVKGNFKHAFVSFVMAMLTLGLSSLVYPFFVNRINKRYYLRRGWVQA